jgi:glyoxylase-like metal-dependent hydrolase (beta-lactamase superfamily II)/rhodanese-related sulfurtransferase
MTVTPLTGPSLPARELAHRLALGRRVTVLDVRRDPSSPIAGSLRVPAEDVLADPGAVAAELDGLVAVVCNRGRVAETVSRALRKHGAEAMVLEGGMRGWLNVLQARPVELGLDGVSVVQVQRPGRGCLSYVIAAGSRALVVDPAPDAEFYLSRAAELGATVTDVFDTHVHADHLSGARALATAAGATLRLPAASLERGIAFADEVEPVHDGDELRLGGVTLRAIALPGHTSDMTGLLIAGVALIAGDSLFADGIARPDLQYGDPAATREMGRTLHRTLRERVLTLGRDVVLLPGHAHPGVHPRAVAPTLAAVRAAVPELALDDADALFEDMPPRPANYEAVIAVNAGFARFDPELEAGGNSCATRGAR